MNFARIGITPALAACAVTASPAGAHHSYAMFDGEQERVVQGSVAKLEWRNPHVYLWVYVPNVASAGGHDLYAFENGSVNVLRKRGWSRDLPAAGERVTVTYWPLRDGRAGGHLVSAELKDGRVLKGAGGPNGADGDLPVPATSSLDAAR